MENVVIPNIDNEYITNYLRQDILPKIQKQNYDFEKKKCLKNKDGKDIGYYNGSYSEIEVSKQNEWTTETIKERGLSMLQFMEERWKFKFKDWEINKEGILFPSNK